MPSFKLLSMPGATQEDIDHQRNRIKSSDQISDETREALLQSSKVMGRFRSRWGYERHESILKRLIILAWGGQKYDSEDFHDASLADALDQKEVAGEIVDWIHMTYDNEETNRDYRGALRTFGKLLVCEDPTDKEATPPPSLRWIPATLPRNYDPLPNPANMIKWAEVEEMCEHPETHPRDAALLAVAWDAGLRSGELEDLRVKDVSDHDLGKILHVDGKTGERDVTITNAVPYLRQWLNQHPGGNDGDAPLWSKIREPSGISYRMFRDIFIAASDRTGLDKPDDPTNFRKSSASDLASKNVSQAHLERRYGWKRGSDAAARYIRVFGEDADRELAKARGIDIDWEPEDVIEGPKDCKRCGVLLEANAKECDNCGFIQDRDEAVKENIGGRQDIGRMINEAVRDTIQEIDPILYQSFKMNFDLLKFIADETNVNIEGVEEFEEFKSALKEIRSRNVELVPTDETVS